MTLLFFTRKIDTYDSRASFVTDWLLALAQNLDQLVVVCQEKGDATGLPQNIKIYSLGKEKGYSKIRQLLRSQALLPALIKKSDGVFIHQMPIYAAISGPWCWLFHKKLIQWYTHKAVDWRLRLAHIFIDEYISASPESFRLPTKKPVHIFGHGININKFTRSSDRVSGRMTGQKDPLAIYYNIISIGRISPSKDYESMIKAIFDLREQGIDNLKLTIIGAPALAEGFDYSQKLQALVESMNLKGRVEFAGGLPQSAVIPYLQSADLFINLSDTGSLDKAVLEAMAAGCLVLTSNESFRPILPKELFVTKDRPAILADQIKYLMSLPEEAKEKFRQQLRQEVTTRHNLSDLVKKIITLY